MFKDSPEWLRGTRDRFRGTLKWIRVTFQIVSGIPCHISRSTREEEEEVVQAYLEMVYRFPLVIQNRGTFE